MTEKNERNLRIAAARVIGSTASMRSKIEEDIEAIRTAVVVGVLTEPRAKLEALSRLDRIESRLGVIVERVAVMQDTINAADDAEKPL